MKSWQTENMWLITICYKWFDIKIDLEWIHNSVSSHCLCTGTAVSCYHSVRSVGGTYVKPTNASSGSSTLALKKAESADLPTDPVKK